MCRQFNSCPRHRACFLANSRKACARADPARALNQCAPRYRGGVPFGGLGAFNSRRLVGLVVAVVVLVVIGAAAVVGPTSRGPAAVSPSAPVPSPSASGVASAAVSELRWSRPTVIPDSAAMLDVVRWRTGYVGVADAVVNAQHVGAAFASQDGVVWQRTATFAGNPMLVAAPSQLIAFVSRDSDTVAVDALVSTDGVTWVRNDHLVLAGVTIAHVVSRDNVLVAVASEPGGRTPRIVRSVGGGVWVSSDAPSPRAIVRNLVTVSDGFLAVGREGEADASSGGVGSPGVGRPAAWWSADGRTWTSARVQGDEAAGAHISDVFRVADGYLAIGSDTTGTAGNPRSAVLWSSADARDWKLLGAPSHWGLVGADGQQLVVFGAADFGTVALGAWTTRDGRGWTQLSFTGDAADVPAFQTAVGQSSRVDAIFVAPDGIVVIGQKDGRPTAWFAELT